MSKTPISKCLKRLRNAKNDTEKFAALLMVSKVMQSDASDEETRSEVFDAVGFGFVRRLLKSNLETEDGNDKSFQQLAVNLLSSFCSDKKLVTSPEMLELLPNLNDMLLSFEQCPGEADDVQMVADTYVCLTCIANRSEGRESLLQHNTVAALCSVISRNLFGCQKAVLLLRFLLFHCGHRCWNGNENGLDELLQASCRKYEEEKDDAKFDSGKFLTEILSSCAKEQTALEPGHWQESAHKTLFAVLKNRLGTKQRDVTIALASALVDLLGVNWILCPGQSDSTSDEHKRYLLLLVHLVCIEVRMSLEDKSIIQVREKSEVVCCCYSLLENFIDHMTTQSSLGLDEKQTSQLYTAMLGAFSAVIHFLDEVRTVHEDQILETITLASVRVLGAWIAEETSALQKEITDLLPFLLRVGKESFELTRDVLHNLYPGGEAGAECSDVVLKRNVPPTPATDVLKFLLPGLCHLTTEDAARNVFLQEGGHTLLVQYFSHLAQLLSSRESAAEVEGSLLSVCGIFLNLAVLEPDLVANDAAFNEILQYIIHTIHLLDNRQHLVYVFNLAALGLMILRHKVLRQGTGCKEVEECGNFFNTVINLLKNAHVCHRTKDGSSVGLQETYASDWSSISELWFLTMQSLGACLPLIPWISTLVINNGWIPQLLTMLWDSKGGPKPDLEVLVSFKSLLCELVTSSEGAMKLVKEKKGVEIARYYGMKELEGVLR